MSAQNYDMKNMRSANALLYLSPQEDRRMVSATPMHDEEDDQISFRGGVSANFQDDVSQSHSYVGS